LIRSQAALRGLADRLSRPDADRPDAHFGRGLLTPNTVGKDTLGEGGADVLPEFAWERYLLMLISKQVAQLRLPPAGPQMLDHLQYGMRALPDHGTRPPWVILDRRSYHR